MINFQLLKQSAVPWVKYSAFSLWCAGLYLVPACVSRCLASSQQGKSSSSISEQQRWCDVCLSSKREPSAWFNQTGRHPTEVPPS